MGLPLTGQRIHLGVVEAGDHRSVLWDALQESPERRHHPVQVPVDIQVVCLDVGDHSNVRVQVQKTPVELIGLGHKLGSPPDIAVGPQVGHLAAHHKARIAAGIPEHLGDHGRGGGLPVGTGHTDPPLPLHQLAQHRRALHHWDAPRSTGDQFRVIRPGSRRIDDDIGITHVLGCMALHDSDPHRFQRFRDV